MLTIKLERERNMIKRRLRTWVIPSLSLVIITGVAISYYLLSNLISYNESNNNFLVTEGLIDNTINVNKEVSTKPIKPFKKDNVEISKYYYKREDDTDRQEKSLIKYNNIYMPNTGVLYSSDEEFEILATLDGKVTNVKEDNILGNIVEIMHSDNLITVYQSVKDVKVKIGDQVKQGDVIALSSSNKLDETKDYCLHFEVYKDGNLIQPEEYFTMEIN